MANDVSLDEVRRLAADLGLSRLTDEHLKQLRGSTQTARARRTALRIEKLSPRDEPAHVYRLGSEVVR